MLMRGVLRRKNCSKIFRAIFVVAGVGKPEIVRCKAHSILLEFIRRGVQVGHAFRSHQRMVSPLAKSNILALKLSCSQNKDVGVTSFRYLIAIAQVEKCAKIFL